MQFPIFSYAINQQQKSQTFFTSSSQEVAAGEIIELFLNLEQINYEKFEFTLNTSSNNINDININ